MPATKSISKSVRLTEEVHGYIMEMPGKGFNEKFENIILEAKKTEAQRKEHLAVLTEQINEKRCELNNLFYAKRYLAKYFDLFENMKDEFDALASLLDDVSVRLDPDRFFYGQDTNCSKQ